MNDDVAAVLADAIANKRFLGRAGTEAEYCDELARYVLDYLTEASVACVYVPEGVAVAHGARLVNSWTLQRIRNKNGAIHCWHSRSDGCPRSDHEDVPLYTIEATP